MPFRLCNDKKSKKATYLDFAEIRMTENGLPGARKMVEKMGGLIRVSKMLNLEQQHGTAKSSEQLL
jgi:hypothetical protein